jgi:hypothetical protein
MYQEKPVDYRCRSPGDMQTLATTGAIQETQAESNTITAFRILDVVYDPDGNDAGREQLHLAYTGAQTLDLADTYLLINDRKKLLE